MTEISNARTLEVTAPDGVTRVRWLEALRPCDANEAPTWVNERLWPHLVSWCELVDDSPARLHLDVDGRTFGAVVDPGPHVIWLGSPKLTLERRLAVLAPSSSAADFAEAWLRSSADASPKDIEHVTYLHKLAPVATHEFDAQHEAVLRLSRQLAHRVQDHIKRYRPRLLERLSQWALGLQAEHESLRVHALRFIALLPSLDHDTRGHLVKKAVLEAARRINMAAPGRTKLPLWLRLSVHFAGFGAQWLPARWLAGVTRTSVKKVAGIFIAGEQIESAKDTLRELQRSGRSATVDQLGELVVTEKEADRYRDEVIANIRGLAREFGQRRTEAGLPYAHVSIKTSALCAHYLADDPEGTWERVGPRLVEILEFAQQSGVFVNVDAEHYEVRDLTLLMLEKALRSSDVLWRWRDVGIVVQAYLTDAAHHIKAVLALCEERGVRMPIRLVKGAYWDAETTEADAHSFDAPQWLNKVETDVSFQQLTLFTLAHGRHLQLCIGSHNLRDHCFARAAQAVIYQDAPPIEHQALHATYEALSLGMSKMGWAVRNYIPVGSLLVGMAYLVRRVMENASQVGVLTMARGGLPLHQVVRTPAETISDAQTTWLRRPLLCGDEPWPGFQSHPPARLYLQSHRLAFDEAVTRDGLLERFSTQRGDGWTGPLLESLDPSCPPSPTLGVIATCAPAEVEAAVQLAVDTSRRPLPPATRCAALLTAAEELAADRGDWAVLVAREAGKSRKEALADVDEAIDFMRFYAEQAWMRAKDDRAGRGVIVAVAPWNFPLAIPCGMVTAALAAGNSVILKSAEQTPIIGELLVQLLRRHGFDGGYVQHAPGDGLAVGRPLVEHPDVAGVLFTGSKAVGAMIHSELAATVHAGHDGADSGKVVVTEMGGKNAVIVTSSADLDEAVSATLYASFAHAGQKCSAASRIFVHNSVFDTFFDRFSNAACDLHLGPALEPGVQVNPVVSAEDCQRLVTAQRRAQEESEQVGGETIASGGWAGGQLVRPSVSSLPLAAHKDPESWSRRELFGPVVHVMPIDDLEQALQAANDSEYALTGGIFSQSQDEIEALEAGSMCGNLYVNRSNTGARVGIEPFGGFRMSGTGPKAGSPAYLEPLYAPHHEPEGPWTQSPPLVVEQGLTGVAPTWPLMPRCLPLNDDETSALLATCAALPPQLGAYISALLNAWATPKPSPTVVIPGQRTLNHVDTPRGPTVVYAARQTPGLTGLAHVFAALRAGAPVAVVAPSEESSAAWRHQLASLLSSAAFDDRLTVQRVQGAAEGAALAADPAVATVVIDGPRRVWSSALVDAFKRRENVSWLPPVWCVSDGPLLNEPGAMYRAHHIVRTVATNTMRHGAPLDA